MKILHCCLANFYVDDFGYQENIIPKFHKYQGYDVEILASTESYINGKLTYLSPSVYRNIDGIKVTRLAYSKWLPPFLSKKIRLYQGLAEKLNSFNPDIIFLHDLQFLDIKKIVRYKNRFPHTIIFIDGHTDFINSARNFFSKYILHKILYRFCAKIIEPFTENFFGTLPNRCDFFEEVYKIPRNKIQLLEFGVDDMVIKYSDYGCIRDIVRSKYNFSDSDFVIVSGGKIDKRKNIELLIDAVEKIDNKKVKLLIFGEIIDNPYLLKRISNNNNIYFLGWQNQVDVLKILIGSDLGCFPGTHSVLWEQSCGIGLPCIFKRWDNNIHLDLGGNCIYINGRESNEIEYIILELLNKTKKYNEMLEVAKIKCIKHFSYSEISKRAIQI